MYEKIIELYNNYKYDLKKYFNIVVCFIVFLSIYYLYYYNKTNSNNNDKDTIVENITNNETNNTIEENTIKEEDINEKDTIYVDVKGEVVSPGVYQICSHSRVADVIKLAGGFTENANTRYTNLSKELNDSDVIIIYSNEEIYSKQKSEIIYVDLPCECETVNDACLDEIKKENSEGKININTSSKEELMTINGIGESKANAIIEYRNNNGYFNSIEEIVNVSGISETLYEKIKEFITV